MQVLNGTSGCSVAHSVQIAASFFSRMRGLLFSPPLSAGQGLYIVPCSAIHMIGMAYAIDAIFMDRQGMVVGLVEDIKPWRLSDLYLKAYGCLELPKGTIAATSTKIGDNLQFIENTDS